MDTDKLAEVLAAATGPWEAEVTRLRAEVDQLIAANTALVVRDAQARGYLENALFVTAGGDAANARAWLAGKDAA